MPTTRAEKGRPSGLLRLALRAPICLYKAHLGWMLGGRAMLLTHVGRRSGQPRHAVVEVIEHDAATDTYVIGSGWGERADWFQNIQKTPRVTVEVGARRFEADAERISVEEAARVLTGYAARHPRAFRQLARFMLGERAPASAEGAARLAAQIPLVALRAP